MHKIKMSNYESLALSINTPLDAIKKEVMEELSNFRGLVVTKEDMPTIKAQMTNLNKISKNLSDSRIKVAKEYKKPLTEFEKEVKAMCNEISSVRDDVMLQVKSIEEEEKNAKREEYKALIAEMTDLPIEFEDKWLNTNSSKKKMLEEVRWKVDKYEKDLKVVESQVEIYNGLIRSNLEFEQYQKALMTESVDVVMNTINSDFESAKRIENQLIEEEPKQTQWFEAELRLTGHVADIEKIKEYIEQNYADVKMDG